MPAYPDLQLLGVWDILFMRIFASLGLLLIVLGLSGGAWYLWEHWGEPVVPAGRYLGQIGAVCIALALLGSCVRRRSLPSLGDFLDERVWALGLVAIWVSDWLCRPWGLFQGPTIRGELLVGAAFSYFLLKRSWTSFFLYWPAVVAIALIWSFDLASKDSLLYSDDHAMFIFRLQLLKENFPSIPFWSPLWNTGFDARDFFATGSLNMFVLMAPLIYLFDIESVYNLMIALVLWILLPGSVFMSTRILKFSALSGSIAATLSMCSGLFWYRWALKYGTLGFIVSSAFFPLCVALFLSWMSSTRPTKTLCVMFVAITTLAVLWSPAGIAMAPLGLIAIPRLRAILTSRRHIICIALLAAINLPWMTMMWRVSNVGKFLDADKPIEIAAHDTSKMSPNESTLTSNPKASAPNLTVSNANTPVFRHRSGSVNFKKSLNYWHNNASALNPVIVVFALPALLSLVGTVRIAYVLTTAWLLALGTVGVALKPQLELDRMLVIASVLLTVPLGSFLVNFFSKVSHGTTWRLSASLASSFILIGPFSATSVTLGRSDDTYTFQSAETVRLKEVLQANARGGRVLFTGCVLHELDGGHLGPLPIWTGVPMVASSYAHNIWRYEQPVPPSFLTRGDPGIEEFFNLVNASIVVAHEPSWIDYFRTRQDRYAKLYEGEKFWVFSRIGYTPSYMHLGAAEDVTFTSRSVSLSPKTSSLVLKFKYFPFLTTSGCRVSPHKVSEELQLIELSECTVGQKISIESVSPLTRIRGGIS